MRIIIIIVIIIIQFLFALSLERIAYCGCDSDERRRHASVLKNFQIILNNYSIFFDAAKYDNLGIIIDSNWEIC